MLAFIWKKDECLQDDVQASAI